MKNKLRSSGAQIIRGSEDAANRKPQTADLSQFARNRKGDEGGPVGLGIGTIFALLVGVVLMIAIVASAGLQFGFLQALTGGAKGEVLAVAQGAYKTDVSLAGNIELKKPPIKKIFSADERIYAMTTGSFRGRGDEIAVLLSNYKIKSLDDYTIIDDINDDFLKKSCRIDKMSAANIRSADEEDLFIIANCPSAVVPLLIYWVPDINDFSENNAQSLFVDAGTYDDGHAAFGDFDGDGKDDLVLATYKKSNGNQLITIFYSFDKDENEFTKSKEILRRPNMRITALVAGDFTGSKQPDILFFTDDKRLLRIKNIDVTKEPYPDAFKIADVGFDVDNNKEVIYANPEGQPTVYVKQAALVVGNFKGDKKQELLIAYGDGGERYGKGHMVLISGLDKDAPESKEIEPEGLAGQGAVQIISLAVGRFS